MKVVLDTNVLVSGLLNPFGAPGRVVDLAVTGGLQPLHDDRILLEYGDVLRRPRFGFDERDIRALLEQLTWVGLHLTAPPISGPIDGMSILRNTWPFNAAGTPAISVPIARQPLPIGLQLIARRGDDDKLLQLARTLAP